MDEKDKKVFLTIIVVAIVALVVSNFGQITGGAISDPSSLSVFQEGKRLTVQVNYPVGKYGKPNKIIDMRMNPGSSLMDVTTECDPDRGKVPGSSRCKREIAEFVLYGDEYDRWKGAVIFTIRGTDVTRDYTIP